MNIKEKNKQRRTFRTRANSLKTLNRKSRSLAFCVALGCFSFGPSFLHAQNVGLDDPRNDTRIFWPRYDFAFPYTVDQTGKAPSEIQLECSSDGGRSWAVCARGDVRTKQLQFQATEDGEYRFRLKTIDNQGRSFDNPGEPLVIVVDTTKPDANLVIDIDQRGVMIAEFAIVDAAIDTNSIQLTYQTESMPDPQEIKFELQTGDSQQELLGNGSWNLPNNAKQLAVRLTAKDRAGNMVEVNRLPQLPRTASSPIGMKLASGKNREPRFASNPMSPLGGSLPIGSGIVPEPIETARPTMPRIEILSGPGARTQADSRFATQMVERQQQLIEQLVQQQQATNEQLINSNLNKTNTNRASTSNGSDSLRTHSKSSAIQSQDMTVDEYEQALQSRQLNFASKRSERSLVVPDQNPGSQVPAPATAPIGNGLTIEPRVESPAPERLERIPGQTPFRNNIKPLFSNSAAFSLDYSVENDPDSPVAAVELWGTTDEGRTWQVWGEDPDRSSPFDIQVEGDGLFGFRMIIVGANGLASNRPRNGDNADAWIHVDTKLPQARINSALYGKGKESGSLVIEYRAADEYFPERPITLSYSETPDGPWTIIASGVRNNGRYVWPADPTLPPSIYLKIEAFDSAGNVAVHRLDSRIDVEGLAPRGRIQGFRPLPPAN